MNENPYGNMDQEAYRVAYLISGYIRNTISETEHDELNDWVNASDHNMRLFEELTDQKHIEQNLAWMDRLNAEESFRKMQEAGAFKKQKRIFKSEYIWIAAASVVLVVLLFFAFQLRSDNKNGEKQMVSTDTLQLQPGGNRARLILENGDVIDLETAKKGLLKNEKGIEVIKVADGELVYENMGAKQGPVVMQTLSTPVGGQFQVTLPDETKVWLNAATTLKFPSAFLGSERKIELNGEAYFEVAKDPKKPFRVLSKGMEVEVLGTKFNINTYSNEPFSTTTLVEGSVKVFNNVETKILEPGQQSQIKGNEINVQEVDIHDVVAWKNNEFKFTDATIETIIRQVQRWYDAEIEFHDKIPEHFNATIDRTEPVSKLLHYLEGTGNVHFKIEGKKIYVMK